MEEKRRVVASSVIITAMILVGFVIFYDVGYKAGEQAVVEEVIENQKEIVYWSNGGFVNSTLYNMSWYSIGNPDQAPHLTEDGFVLLVVVNVILPNQDDAPAHFDCTISWAHQMGNITLERIYHYTRVYNSSQNRERNTFIPANTTGATILFGCYHILQVLVFGHGTSTPEMNVNLLASQVVKIRPDIGGGG